VANKDVHIDKAILASFLYSSTADGQNRSHFYFRAISDARFGFLFMARNFRETLRPFFADFVNFCTLRIGYC